MVNPPKSVLTIMAHPDDAELWAGGYLAQCVHIGAQVTIALPRHGPERDAEAEAGAVVLGTQLREPRARGDGPAFGDASR